MMSVQEQERNALDLVKRSSEKKGIKKGLDQGISGAVEILKSLDVDDDTIVKKIVEKYGISEEKAKEYLK